MKKVIILIISIATLCVGCVISENQSVTESMIQTTIPENETITTLSPDGKYRAEAYGTNANVTAGGLYPYEGISVIKVENDEVLFEMNGYYVVDFVWSADGRYVAIYYESRIYGESIIFDTKVKKSISLPMLEVIALNYEENEKPQVNRPDPYFRIIDWEDEETVRLDFRWNRENSEPFSSSFSFNIKTHKVTC